MILFRRTLYTLLAICCTALAMPLAAPAQGVLPSASPKMWVLQEDGSESDLTSYDGSAPMQARFVAEVSDLGSFLARYEWRFYRQGEEKPFLTRYEEDTEYTFRESGAFTIELFITFTQGTDTLEFTMDSPFMVNISESKLEFPNAITPNGDGINDVLRAKEGYQSIISFEAAVFDRWGKRLYEWTDLRGGWDGRNGGKVVPDGAYYLVVKARGADGRHYNIRKVINVLTGYSERGGSTVSP